MFKSVVEAQREAVSKITKVIEDPPAASPAFPFPQAEFADPLPIASAADTVLGLLGQSAQECRSVPEKQLQHGSSHEQLQL